MPEWLWSVILFFTVVLGYLALVAFMGRIRKGQFRIHRAATGAIEIQTDVGMFSVDPSARVLTVEVGGPRRAVSFNQIKALRYGYKTEPSWLTELAFGLDLWDLFPRWTDQCEWYAISLVVNEGPEIPLYVAGQVERREPGLGWWYATLNVLLQRIGLHDDVAERSRAVLNGLLAAFASEGHRLQLA